MNLPDDEIIEEIRKRREAHAASLGFDASRIAADLRGQEQEDGAVVVNRPPRKPQPESRRSPA